MKKVALMLLVLAGGGSLSASDSGFQFGSEFFCSHPVGLLDSAYTYAAMPGVGIFYQKDLGSGHGLRWNVLSWTNSPNISNRYGEGMIATKINTTSSMVNYIYHFRGENKGPYLLAGLGVRACDTSVAFTKVGPGLFDTDKALRAYTQYAADTGWKTCVTVGGGFDFTNQLGLTVRCQGIQSLGHTLATLEAGFNFRF